MLQGKFVVLKGVSLSLFILLLFWFFQICNTMAWEFLIFLMLQGKFVVLKGFSRKRQSH